MFFFLLLPTALLSRLPSNVVGTDIFPDSLDCSIEVRTGKDATEKRTWSLPTKALNLAYGAECFETCLQPLYHFTEAVSITQKSADDVTKLDTLSFLHDAAAIEKTVKSYNEINPIAILIRALFIQIPGTQGLNDLRVSKTFISSEESGAINWEKTLQIWSEAIITTLKIISLPSIYPDQKLAYYQNNAQTNRILKMVSDTSFNQNPILRRLLGVYNFNIANKPSIGALLFDCTQWTKKHGLGEDFTIRIFMAGVYALIGHDKRLIEQFYDILKRGLSTDLPALAEEIETFPAAYSSTVSDKSPSKEFYINIRQLTGLFKPITYSSSTVNGIHFPDCMETLIRNIVLILIMQETGSFDITFLHKPFQAFFQAFPTLEAQMTPAAHTAWGELVSNLDIGLTYCCPTNCEIDATPRNVFIALNYIFNLEIPALVHPEPAETFNAPLKKYIDQLNEQYTKKSISPFRDCIDIINLTEASLDFSIKGLTSEFTGTINFGGHGEIQKKATSERERARTNLFPFLEHKINQDPSARYPFNILTLDNPFLPFSSLTDTSEPYQWLIPFWYHKILLLLTQEPRRFITILLDPVDKGFLFSEAINCLEYLYKNDKLAECEDRAKAIVIRLLEVKDSHLLLKIREHILNLVLKWHLDDRMMLSLISTTIEDAKDIEIFLSLFSSEFEFQLKYNTFLQEKIISRLKELGQETNTYAREAASFGMVELLLKLRKSSDYKDQIFQICKNIFGYEEFTKALQAYITTGLQNKNAAFILNIAKDIFTQNISTIKESDNPQSKIMLNNIIHLATCLQLGAKKETLNLFKALSKEGFALAETLDFANKTGSLNLYRILAKKDFNIDAIEGALEEQYHSITDTSYAKLLNELISKNRGLDLALKAAKRDIKHADSIALLSILIEKNYELDDIAWEISNYLPSTHSAFQPLSDVLKEKGISVTSEYVEEPYDPAAISYQYTNGNDSDYLRSSSPYDPDPYYADPSSFDSGYYAEQTPYPED